MDLVDYIKSFPLREFAKNEQLFGVDDSVDTLLIIRDGSVKVSLFDANGQERLLWLAGRYDIVPTEQLFTVPVTAQYFYTGLTDGSAYVVDKPDFLRRAKDNPAMLYQIARGLSEHHDDLLQRLNSVEQPDLRHKILSMLLVVAEKYSGADTVKLHEAGLNLTHQNIADMVHATREAVSLAMKQLQTEGLVDYSRATLTINAAAIHQLIDDL